MVRQYATDTPAGELLVRLYTLTDYLDELGGSMDRLLEAAEEEYWTALGPKFRDYIEGRLRPEEMPERGGFPFVGAMTLHAGEDFWAKADELDMVESWRLAEDLVGLGRDDYYPIPPNDERWGVMEDDPYLLKRWPPDAPTEVLRNLGEVSEGT
jgi:hypothetical protein